ncbi:hypothetical protein DFR24_2440 [Panacagrimonas perspica]|uniref:Lipoprotein n=1 Tax=Panacagrimonas perspica TaxID=381431 RepID=A0A4R7P4D4_9GAMM|nr:hypothetical protein [Panacagrimonas perspica]TDU28081.1 hypothetical protein DFR24_2440 [Panacagrimonas perspica]THD03495.1 hypothetical protein B1810_09595 [Panacagrimonas perspica]
MFAFRRVLIAISIALSLFAVGGCASKKTIDATSAESVISGVNKGDNVRITTRNDVVHKFVVTKITNKALYGENERVVYEDMSKVEVLKKEKDKKEGEGFWSKLF